MVIFIIVLFSLIAAYWFLNIIMHTIPEVEAGPTSNLTSTGVRRMHGRTPPSFRKRESNGSITLHRNFVVTGKCMEKANIKDGSIVDVRIFNKDDRKHLNDFITQDKVVLIYLNDKNFRGYKLRIIRKVENDRALTYYYQNEDQVESSKPHALKDIIGIVEF